MGPYEIIRPLGVGGMGGVLLARDTRLGRLAALKFMHAAPSSQAAKRFVIEARATALLSHENVVVIYDVGDHQGRPFMALEYVKGQTLREWIKERKATKADSPGLLVPPQKAVELMLPVVRALAHAHERGIVHRDLKPANVMLTETGGVKVLDFGIAKILSDVRNETRQDSAPGMDFPTLTEKGAAIGTTTYMAPEQWGIGDVDHRADLWTVGLMFHEILFGASPLRALLLGDAGIAGLATLLDLDAPLSNLRGEHPELGKLAAIIDRCLIKRKEHRIASARELVWELSALSTDDRDETNNEESNPFAGLSAFQESDAARFFGRERAIHQAVARLVEQPLLAVIGPPGAGKSSFVRAGLIPALKQSGDAWEAFTLRPGPRPLASLAELLTDHGWQSSSREQSPSDLEVAGAAAALEREAILSRLSAEPGFLARELRARARRKRQRILLFIDQFEEVYALAPESDRAVFFACLAGVADDVDSPLRVVLTLRADFLDRLGDAPSVLPDLGRGFLLVPLDRSGLREALMRPLASLDYRFEPPEMVEEMLDELAHARGALPLMQFTAAQLWEQRDTSLRVLTEASYRALGGVAGTLARHADAVVSPMPASDKKIARALLLRLVTPERTRALARLQDLREVGSSKEVRSVIDRLLAARLLTLEGSGEDEGTVEIVHESLIAHWPALARWLDEAAEDASFLDRLRRAAREWRASGEREGLLWTGEQADEASRFAARTRAPLAHAEVRFLAKVIALSHRSRRRRRQIVGAVIALLSAAALSVSYLAVRAHGEAQRAAEQAVRADQKADEASASAGRARNASRMAAALANQNDPTTALALARELEPGSIPPGWGTLARWTLDVGVARAVIPFDGAVVEADWSADGRRIAFASKDKTVRIWSADGSGEPLVLRGHEGGVNRVAWGPDGRRVGSASQDKTVRIWNADGSGEPLVLRGHEDAVNTVAWSPDGRRIASASQDRTVRIWSADGSGEPLVLRGHDDRVSMAVWSADGRHIASASFDKTVRIWNADGSGEPLVLRGHEDPVSMVAFSPDGRRIVTASLDKTVRSWSAERAGRPLVLRGHDDRVYSAAFSPDGRRIVTASLDKTVRIWNADDSGRPLVLRGHQDRVTSAVFSPDGRRIVSASGDGTARVWDADTARELLVLRGHHDHVRWVGWSPDGRRIATASQDTTARIWDATSAGRALLLHGHEGTVWWTAFSPDGRRIVSASCDKTVRVWNADGSGEPLVLRGHDDCVYTAVFSPDGRRIVSASWDKTVRVWDLDGTRKPFVFHGHHDHVYAATVSPDGRRIASAGYDKTVQVWNADGTGDPLVLRGHEMQVWAVAFSPDGRRIASASPDRTVRVWNADGTGEPLVLHTPDVPNGVAFSPDGRRLACGLYDRTVWIWSADGQGEPLVLRGHESSAGLGGGRPWRPDGRQLLSHSTDGTIRVWNAEGTGQPVVLRTPNSTSSVASAAFDPEGRRIVAAGEGWVSVWDDFDLPPGSDDPRLWSATRYCPSIELRTRLLDVTEEMAGRDLARCEQRVREAWAKSADPR